MQSPKTSSKDNLILGIVLFSKNLYITMHCELQPEKYIKT